MKKGLFLLLAIWMLASAAGANAQVLDTVPVVNVTSETVFDGAPYVTYQQVEGLCMSSRLATSFDVVELLYEFYSLDYKEQWFQAAVSYLSWLESDEDDYENETEYYSPMVVVFKVIDDSDDSYDKFVVFSWNEDVLQFAILSEDGLWVIDEEIILGDDWSFLISRSFISLIGDGH